jgi:hypothetical protein
LVFKMSKLLKRMSLNKGLFGGLILRLYDRIVAEGLAFHEI